jgi:hypothetical protein
MTVIDIINQQNEKKAHEHQFVLWPRMWQDYSKVELTHNWHLHQLIKSEKVNIPIEPGIYTLLIQPGIASHPACSYLMYVGQASSLRRRFGEYLTSEKRKSGRPNIFRLLNMYENNLWFCYTLVSNDQLDMYEDALMASYLPPKNSPSRLTANMRPVMGAF